MLRNRSKVKIQRSKAGRQMPPDMTTMCWPGKWVADALRNDIERPIWA